MPSSLQLPIHQDASAKEVRMEQSLASSPILIAIPDAWQTFVVQALSEGGYSCVTVASYQEALIRVQSDLLCGIIMTNEWALQHDEDNHTLFDHVRGRIPSLTLIKNGGNPVIIQVFNPPKHQYLTIPFSKEEVIGLIWRARMIESLPF